MALIDTSDTWKYLALKVIIVLFVSIITFDMMSYWDRKERDDLRIIIYGVGGIGLAISALISENFHSFLLMSKIIIILTSMGILASRKNIDTKTPPRELYISTYSAIFILVLSIIWWYLFEEKKKIIKPKKEESCTLKERRNLLNEDLKYTEPPGYNTINKQIKTERNLEVDRILGDLI